MIANWRKNELYLGYKNLVLKMFDYTISSQQYIAFGEYCEQGLETNGVRTVWNPVNLYAFCIGESSQTAADRWRKEEESE